MLHLKLYTTLGCHLCELAEQVIARSYLEPRPHIELQDIADDPVLTERYGIRIPVIHHQDSGSELGWPFNETALTEWYKSIIQG